MMGQHAHIVQELGKHWSRKRNYWKIILVSRDNNHYLFFSPLPWLKYYFSPPSVLESPYNLLMSEWAWMWRNIPSIPWYLLHVRSRYLSRIVEDRKGWSSIHLIYVSVEESLYGRLVMVHGKMERGHLWEAVGQSTQWYYVLECSECCGTLSSTLLSCWLATCLVLDHAWPSGLSFSSISLAVE